MRVMLLSMPQERLFPILFPSLSIATLVSYLKSKSIKVTADDIHIRMFHHAKSNQNPLYYDILEDTSRLRRFLSGEDDEQLSAELRRTLSLIPLKSPDIIGLSFPYYSEQSVLFGDAIAKILKEDFGVVTVVGGDIAFMLNHFMKSDNIDYIFLPGEGHVPLANLIESLDSRKSENVPSRILSHNVRLPGPDEPPLQVAGREFVPPDFSEFPLELYRFTCRLPGIKMKPTLLLPYRFVKNCIFNCAFCPYSENPGCFVDEPSRVAEQLRSFCRKHKTRDFIFFNTNANITKDYAYDLIAAFKEYDLDINWVDCLNFMNLDSHMLSELHSIGLRKAIVGLECPSERMLRALNKPIQLSAFKSLLRCAQESGVWIELELIPGLPYETEEDIQSTIKFIESHLHNVSLFHLNRFKMMRSQFWANPEKYGLRIHEPAPGQDLSLGYPFDELDGLQWEQKRKQIGDSFCRIKDVVPFSQTLAGKEVPTSLVFVMNKYLRPKTGLETFKSVISSFTHMTDTERLEMISFKK